MKTRWFSISTVFFLLISMSVIAAPEKEETFKVYGNCNMCKKRIETAAKSVDGVISADWNVETKMLDVTYDESKTDLQQINEAIAKAGHDTDTVKASDEAYNKLPGCCKYERKKETD